MRVVWICEYPGWRFADQPALAGMPPSHPVPWVTGQAPLVAAAGVDLHIVTVSRHVRADAEFAHEGIAYHFLKIPRWPRAATAYQIDRRRLSACVRRLKPALVHGFGTESSFGYSAVSLPYPSVVMMQGLVARITRARGWATLLREPGLCVSLAAERVTIRRARHVICETQYAADFVRTVNPRAAVHALSTPIADRWFDVVRAPDGGPEILFVGWVVPAKGVDVLVEAFGRVATAFPEATLHIAGAAEPRFLDQVLRPSVHRLGVAARVRFHGQLSADEIAARLSTATLLVLPTRMDTAPNVLAEARAAGVPIVATRVGGIPELVDDGVDGVLIPVNDPDALAQAVADLLGDAPRRAAIAERGRARAQRDHRLATQVPRLLAVYRDIVGAAA